MLESASLLKFDMRMCVLHHTQLLAAVALSPDRQVCERDVFALQLVLCQDDVCVLHHHTQPLAAVALSPDRQVRNDLNPNLLSIHTLVHTPLNTH